MNNKLTELIGNYLNEQKNLSDKYTRLFNQIKQTDIYSGLNSNSIIDLKKRQVNSDYSYNSNKEKFYCQFCEKQYTSRLPLKNHIEKFHFQEYYPLKCEISIKQITPQDDNDDANNDNSYNESEQQLRQKQFRNNQTNEQGQSQSSPQEEVIISALDSDLQN